ncbi:hypothetical protein ACFL47_06490 [Candidatus Latescibacterota bacterium]
MIKDTIKDIQTKLDSGSYSDIEHVRFSIVTRLLGDLGWDIWNPSEVDNGVRIVEGEIEASCAIFAGAATPAVLLVPVPPDGLAQDDGDFVAKVTGFSGDKDALIAIQTDGRVWNLYYFNPAETFSGTCFKTLDLIEETPDKIETVFTTYLSKEALTNGSAHRDARDYLWLSAAVQIVTDILPDARKIVTEPPYPRLPQAVVKLVGEKGLDVSEDDVLKIMENLDNSKPLEPSTQETDEPVMTPESTLQPEEAASKASEPGEAEETIEDSSPEPPGPETEETPTPSEEQMAPSENRQLANGSSPPSEQPIPAEKPQSHGVKRNSYLNKPVRSFVFLGESYTPKSWKDMLLIFCRIIVARHPQDFYQCIKLQVNDRQCFSRNVKDFFGLSPVKIGDTDFYLMTDLNSNEIVELAYEIAELFSYTREDLEILTG